LVDIVIADENLQVVLLFNPTVDRPNSQGAWTTGARTRLGADMEAARATSTLQWRIGLKALGPERPIREADIAFRTKCGSVHRLTGLTSCATSVARLPTPYARQPRLPFGR
jgi:hypothetical protein